MSPLILIVENSEIEINTIAAATLLVHRDCEIMSCTSAEQAWSICEETPPDLIICNDRLRGIDGYELCKRLKKNRTPCCDIPFMMISSTHDKVMGFIDSLLAGAFTFESKPLSLRRFKDGVARGLALSCAKRGVHELDGMVGVISHV